MSTSLLADQFLELIMLINAIQHLTEFEDAGEGCKAPLRALDHQTRNLGQTSAGKCSLWIAVGISSVRWREEDTIYLMKKEVLIWMAHEITLAH